MSSQTDRLRISSRFAERVVVITRGDEVGRAVAARLSSEGANVVFLGCAPEPAKTVALMARGAGGSEQTAWASDPGTAGRGGIERAVDHVVDRFGRIDVLVNNVDARRDAVLARISEDSWDTVMDANLKSVFLCTQSVHLHMVREGRGAVVNVSGRPVAGTRGRTSYDTSKAAIAGLTASMAQELGAFGIRVNAVAPGFLATDESRGAARRAGKDPASVERRMARHAALQRIGRPADVAAVVAFLASDDARHMTGQTLTVDGGLR